MIATARQLCDKIQTVRPMKFDENFVRPIGFEGPFTTANMTTTKASLIPFGGRIFN